MSIENRDQEEEIDQSDKVKMALNLGFMNDEDLDDFKICDNIHK